MLPSIWNLHSRQRIFAHKKSVMTGTALFLSLLSASPQVFAGFNSLTFRPAADQGYYLTVDQSKTLGKKGYAFGLMADYSNDSLIFKNAAGVKTQDVIQKQIGLNLGGAFGITDWLDVGVNIAGVPYQQFVTPITQVQDNGARFGDITANLKIQLINSEISPVGLALVPFISFPIGSDSHFTGEDGFSGGGKVVVDSKRISDRVSLSANAGGLIRNNYTFSPGYNVIDDQFIYGGAVNVKIVEPVQLIAELNGSTSFANFFASRSRNLEMTGAIRFLPGENKNWQITAGGGAGILPGAGTPSYRLFSSVALRFPQRVQTQKMAEPIREKVISTNEIHFAFNKSAIKPSSYPILDEILNEIQSNSDIQSVRVEGHTDNVGSDAYNQTLSQARADSVRNYFVNKGFPSEKISAVGAGESTPVADNETKSGRALNRRTELHLLLNNNTNSRVEKSSQNSPTYEDGDNHK